MRTPSPAENQDEHQDFYSMGAGLINLKVITGFAQIIFGVIVYIVNHFFFEEDIVMYAAYATVGFGIFLVGVKSQTIVSPSRKMVRITKGFFFIAWHQEISASMIHSIQVIKKSHRGTDRSGIGPTRENVQITTYYVQLILTNKSTKEIYSGSEFSDVNEFAEKVSIALDVRLEPS